MNYLRNWRYYIIFALFSIGIFATLLVFGNKAPETTEAEYWKNWFIALIVAITSWFALVKCVTYWERRKKLPEWN